MNNFGSGTKVLKVQYCSVKYQCQLAVIELSLYLGGIKSLTA